MWLNVIAALLVGCCAAEILINVSPEYPALVDYQECWSEPFDVSMKTSIDVLSNDICNREEWFVGCRRVGSTNFTLLAHTLKSSLLNNTNEATAENVIWYFGRDSSMGFAPRGSVITLTSCDYDFIAPQQQQYAEQRLCVQTKHGFISSGFRCGNQTFLNGNPLWERVILHKDAPTMQPTVLPSAVPTTSLPTHHPTTRPTSQQPTRSPAYTHSPTPIITLQPTTLQPSTSPTPTDQFFSGVRTGVNPSLYSKWQLCWSENYSVIQGTLVNTLFDTYCTKKRLMMACGNETLWITAANAPRQEVLLETALDDTHLANGVEWYYTEGYSFGYAPQGSMVERVDCDIIPGDDRMCVHQAEDEGISYVEFGYRCGNYFQAQAYAFNRMFYETDEEPEEV